MLSRTTFTLLCATFVLGHTPDLARAHPLPDCEWCGASEAPDDVTSSTTIAGADEPGERLLLQGTIYAPDGVTPVPGVLLYVYHTNTAGVYAKRGDETGWPPPRLSARLGGQR